MDCSRLNLLVTVISCLAILTFPIFVTGCGSSNDDDDENMSNNVVTPDQEPVSEPTPQAEAQPEPEPQLQPEPVLPAQPEPVPEVSFQEEILPILQARCAVQGCHADPNPRKELNLETYAGFEKGSGGGPVFNPGDSNGSKVVQRIDGGGMPPGAPLDQDQIQLFKDWIDEGAKDN
jgi:hypothetical protein